MIQRPHAEAPQQFHRLQTVILALGEGNVGTVDGSQTALDSGQHGQLNGLAGQSGGKIVDQARNRRQLYRG